MTKEQIEMLRKLIQEEIECADTTWLWQGEQELTKNWNKFAESFNSQEETEWTETGSGV